MPSVVCADAAASLVECAFVDRFLKSAFPRRRVHGRMGTPRAGRGCVTLCLWALLHLSLASQDVSPRCTDDDRCHFGTCEQKSAALAYVAHNRTILDCSHPYSVALRVFINRKKEPLYAAEAQRCGVLYIQRPACETRVVKTPLDTVLIIIFSTLSIFFVSEDLHLSI